MRSDYISEPHLRNSARSATFWPSIPLTVELNYELLCIPYSLWFNHCLILVYFDNCFWEVVRLGGGGGGGGVQYGEEEGSFHRLEQNENLWEITTPTKIIFNILLRG